MPASRSADVTQSDVSKVFEALKAQDDFVTVSQIMIATSLGRPAVIRALWWLQKSRAAESVESSGDIHWFATPETDTRTHTIDERKKEEDLPRKPKRSYVRLN